MSTDAPRTNTLYLRTPLSATNEVAVWMTARPTAAELDLLMEFLVLWRRTVAAHETRADEG